MARVDRRPYYPLPDSQAEKAIAWLAKQPKGVDYPVKDIAKGIGVGSQGLSDSMRQAVKFGVLIQTNKGIRRPRYYFRVTDTPTDEHQALIHSAVSRQEGRAHVFLRAKPRVSMTDPGRVASIFELGAKLADRDERDRA